MQRRRSSGSDFKALHAQLAGLVTAMRQAAAVSQVELARRLSRPQSFVAKIETNSRSISVVDLVLVAHALHSRADEVVQELANAFGAGDSTAASPAPGERAQRPTPEPVPDVE